MKSIVFAALISVALSGPTYARPGGCLKGAVIGGIAGHLAHHGVLGAAAGCAYGVHKRHNYERQQEQGRSSYQRGGAGYR